MKVNRKRSCRPYIQKKYCKDQTKDEANEADKIVTPRLGDELQITVKKHKMLHFLETFDDPSNIGEKKPIGILYIQNNAFQQSTISKPANSLEVKRLLELR